MFPSTYMYSYFKLLAIEIAQALHLIHKKYFDITSYGKNNYR